MDLEHINHAMFLHAVRCARRGPHGEWVLLLDEPTDDRATQLAFIKELFDAILRPEAERERNGAIEHAIADTTTSPPDGGSGA